MLNTVTASHEAGKMEAIGRDQIQGPHTNSNSYVAIRGLASEQQDANPLTEGQSQPRDLADAARQPSKPLVQIIDPKIDQTQEDQLNMQAHQILNELNLDQAALTDVQEVTQGFDTNQSDRVAPKATQAKMKSLELSEREKGLVGDQ